MFLQTLLAFFSLNELGDKHLQFHTNDRWELVEITTEDDIQPPKGMALAGMGGIFKTNTDIARQRGEERS